MKEKVTLVIEKDVAYSRTGYLKLVNDKVIFDTSDEEYGPLEFDIKELEEKLKAHKLL